MKLIVASLLAGAMAFSLPAYTADNKVPETKTVCLDVQGKDGKPVIDKKTGKPKQNCVKVKIRKKFEGKEVPTKK